MIELRGIGRIYCRKGVEPVRALDDVSLALERGELLAVVGSSGSGKTTLMNIVGLLDRPTEGQYRIDGRDVASLSADEEARWRNKRFGFVFQAFRLMPRASAEENVELPLLYSDRPRIGGLARAALEAVGLGDRLRHRPGEMSGGQQQRVAIARALVHEPRLLVCDEPTSALDAKAGRTVMELIKSVAVQPGRAVVVVTHDSRVYDFADRIVSMSDGQIDGVQDSK